MPEEIVSGLMSGARFHFWLLIAELMFLYSYRRRSLYIVRLLCGTVAIYIIGFLVRFLINGTGDLFNLLFTVFYFLGVFFLSCLSMWLCYKEKFWTVMIACSAGYATQHISTKISNLFSAFLRSSIPAGLDVVAGVVLCYVIPMTVIFFIFALPAKRNDFKNNGNMQLNIISVVMVLLCILLNRLIGSGHNYGDVISDSVYTTVVCVMALIIQYSLFRTQKKDVELKVAKEIYGREREEYKKWKKSIEVINIKCHDLRHKIATLREGYSGQTVKEIEDAIMIYDNAPHTGNEVADLIFFEKGVQCEHKGIKFFYMINGEALSFMTDDDIFSLFGNIIENAMESVEVLPLEKRVISFTVKEHENFTVFHQENYYQGERDMRDGIIVSQKKDTDYHGFGMKSIQLIVEKYGGKMDIDLKKNVFRLNILFPHTKRA